MDALASVLESLQIAVDALKSIWNMIVDAFKKFTDKDEGDAQ